MAIIAFDSLDHYADSGASCDIGQLARAGYTANQPSSGAEGPELYLTSGPFGGVCMSPGRNNNDWVRWRLPSNVGTQFYFAAWIKFFDTIDTGNEIFGFFSDDNVKHLRLYVNSGGTITIQRNTTTLETTVDALAAERWYHLEFTGTIANTNGAYTLKINNTTWATDSTSDTLESSGNANIRSIISYGEELDSFRFTKWGVWSTSGDAPTGSIGPHKCWTVRPNADTAQADFTPQGAGDNYVEVDDVNADDDSTYVESGTVTDMDRLDCGALPETPTAIYAVQARVLSKQTGAGSLSIKPGLYSGTTESKVATAIPVGIEWQYDVHLTTLNPDDSAAWEEADVNAAKVQYEVA